MQLHIDQIGPATQGFMTMEGAGSGAVLVWVGDPPVGTYPNGNAEYWFLPTGMPSSAFTAVQGTGAGPSYDSHQGAWRACENKPFGPPLTSSYTVTIGASDHIYDVARFVNGTPLPGATIRMWVRQTGSGLQIGWVAEGLPAGQKWLFPDGTTGTMALAFQPQASGTYTFPIGARAAIGPFTTV